jgi:hypothetical protein
LVESDDLARYDNARWKQVSGETSEHQPAGQDWEPSQVPTGTVTDVLEWVGDDDLRRQSALTVERYGPTGTGEGKNRKGVIDALS